MENYLLMSFFNILSFIFAVVIVVKQIIGIHKIVKEDQEKNDGVCSAEANTAILKKVGFIVLILALVGYELSK